MIRISINSNNKDIIVSVDENNFIKNVLDVLIDRNIINDYQDKIYSNRLKRKIDVNNTFREVMIFNGDKLCVN